MFPGVSTACLYPMATEQAFQTLANLSIRQIEIFINTPSELSPSFLNMLMSMKNYYGCNITSIHPYLSAFEPFLFFTEYERRFQDGLDWYRSIFKSAAVLGAQYVVFHGNQKNSSFENQRYFERYYKLYQVGKEEYGVTLCQENVERCKSRSVDFIKEMRKALGHDACFVLDVKQALRSGTTAFEMMEAMGEQIRHIHISDSTIENDCLPIGDGKFDFLKFKNSLDLLKYDGYLILELYRHNFQKVDNLYESYMNLNKICR